MAKGESRRANLDGHVRRRADGRVEVQMQIGNRRRSFYGKTEAEAKRKAREALHAHDKGGATITGRLTVAGWLDEWLANDAKPNVRPGTFRSYEGHVRLYLKPEIGSIRLTSLAGLDVQRLLAALLARGLSAQTVRNARATLHRAIERAVKLERVGRNVVDLVDAPKVRRTPVKGMSPSDAQALMSAFRGHELEGFVTVVLLTGLRRSEALGLAWEDIDLDKGSLVIRHQLLWEKGVGLRLVEPKTDKRNAQELPLAPEVVVALKYHRVVQSRLELIAGSTWKGSGLVFTTAHGGPRDGAGVWRSFRDRLVETGLSPKRIHDLRHGFGTLSVSAGIHPRVVSELMGHTRIATTMDIYAQALPDNMREAVGQLGALVSRG